MATKKLRVYISSPITIDKDRYEDKFSKYVAIINASNYEDEGLKVYPYEAVNPLDYKQDCWKDVDGAKDKFSKGCWEQFIIKDIELLATCDAIVMFPGWEHSYGCTIEYLAARRMGKHVILDSGLEKDYDFTLAHLLDHWSNYVLQGANECYLDNSRWESKLRSTINKMLKEAKEKEDNAVLPLEDRLYELFKHWCKNDSNTDYDYYLNQVSAESKEAIDNGDEETIKKNLMLAFKSYKEERDKGSPVYYSPYFEKALLDTKIENGKAAGTTTHYYAPNNKGDNGKYDWYVVHETLTDRYYQCDAAYSAAWELKGSEKKSLLNKLKNGFYKEIDAAHIKGDTSLWEKALKKQKSEWKAYEPLKAYKPNEKIAAIDDVEVDDEAFDEAYEEDVDDSKWDKLKREVKVTPKLFLIGDIVRPTEEASKRNKEFTTDRRFIVTGEQDRAFEDDQPVWYDLAIEGSSNATYCLPSNEMTLVQRTAWKRYQD